MMRQDEALAMFVAGSMFVIVPATLLGLDEVFGIRLVTGVALGVGALAAAWRLFQKRGGAVTKR